MKKTNADYVKAWKDRNRDKVKQYNKQYLENLKKKAVEEALKERDKNND